MPWNATYYPPAMAHLPEVVRTRTICVANALLREGMDESKAIPTAIKKARDWAAEQARSNDQIGARMNRI